MDSRELALSALRRGHFHEVLQRLPKRPATSPDDSVLHAELLYQLGRTDEAVHTCEILLRSSSLPDFLASRCLGILADDQWYAGNASKAIPLYQRASARARASGDVALICLTTLRLLERTCESTGFDASVSLARSARRFAAQSADPQIHAQTHLTFGRLEAKIGNLELARKHFHLTRELISTDPNQFLLSSADIDESVVSWIAGDIVGATELAERGVALAVEIGWSKGAVAGRANLACLYVCLDRLSEARKQIEHAFNEPFSSQSFRVALADTKVRALIAQREFEQARSLLDEEFVEVASQPWYGLTAEQTRIELLLSEGRWSEALDRLRDGLSRARQAKLAPLVTALELLQIDALTQACVPETAISLPDAFILTEMPVRVAGSAYATIGIAFRRLGNVARGDSFVSRAKRVLEETGDLTRRRSLSEVQRAGGYDVTET